MKEQIRKIARSELVRNSAKLLSANVIAQAIGLLVYPILTRLYSPEDFGLLNLFLSIGGVLVLLSTAEYQYAIVLPKKDEEARGLVHICGFLLLITTGIVLLSVPFSKPIACLFNTPELANWYWLMPLFVFVMGLWNILNYWYLRKKAYNHISGYQMWQSILSASGKLGFGKMGYLQGGLISSTIIAAILSIITSLILSWKNICHTLFCSTEIQLTKIAKKYKNYPIYSLPHSLTNIIASSLPTFIMIPTFGTKIVGYWGVAILLGFSPLSIIARTLNQIIFQHISNKVNCKQKIGTFFLRFTLYAIGTIVPIFFILYYIIPQIVQILLGPDWIETSNYLRILLPWLGVNFLTASAGSLYDIFFQQKSSFYFELCAIFCRIIGLYCGVLFNNPHISILGYSIGSTIVTIIQYVWLMILVRRHDQSLHKV